MVWGGNPARSNSSMPWRSAANSSWRLYPLAIRVPAIGVTALLPGNKLFQQNYTNIQSGAEHLRFCHMAEIVMGDFMS